MKTINKLFYGILFGLAISFGVSCSDDSETTEVKSTYASRDASSFILFDKIYISNQLISSQ